MNILLLMGIDDATVVSDILRTSPKKHGWRSAHNDDIAMQLLVSTEFIPDVIMFPLGCNEDVAKAFLEHAQNIEHLRNVFGILIQGNDILEDSFLEELDQIQQQLTTNRTSKEEYHGR